MSGRCKIECEVRAACDDAMQDDFQRVRDEFMELLQDRVETELLNEWQAHLKKRRPLILDRLMNEHKDELDEMLAPVREAWEDRIRVSVDERLAELAGRVEG